MVKRHTVAILVALFSIALTVGEGRGANNEHKAGNRANMSIQGLSMNQKVFFGHQSVGANIIGGMILLDPRMPISKVDAKNIDTTVFERPVFAHASIGKNGNPLSKYEAFKIFLDSGIGDRVDIAGMKLCYLDISTETDATDVFNKYKDMVRHIKRRYPKLKLIHITTPLTVKSNPIKDLIKKVLGKEDIWKDANRNRIQYNNLLRAEYKGIDPVFNLDVIEAFGADSAPGMTNDTNFSLDKRFASDWGHLNDLGKRTVAGEFIRFLESAGRRPH